MDKLHQKLVGRKGFYAFWHEQEHHQLLQWLVLILIAAFIALLLVDRARQPDPASYGLESQAGKPVSGAPVPPLALNLLFIHPECALQPTATGMAIRTIHDFGDNIFFGCGDWGANTGPITIRSYNPATGTSAAEYSMATEQIARFVTVGNRLYAAGIDPGGGGNTEFAFRELGSSTWTGGNNTTAGFVHVFDIASLDGQGIWLCGATNPDNGAGIYSPDGTKTWRSPQSVAPDLDIPGNSTSAGFNRLYFCGAYNGKMYTQSPYYKNSNVYDPATNTWANGPDLLPDAGSHKYPQLGYGSRPLQFAGKLVYSSAWTGCCYGRMLAFDGSRVTDVLKPISANYEVIADLQEYNGYLYVLAVGGNGFALLRTSDLVHWQAAGSIPAAVSTYPYSFRILDGIIYLGSGDAKVYSAPLPTNFVPLN